MTEIILVQADDMKTVFQDVLLKNGFTKEKASDCAEIFTSNSIDGIYTHGVNRFATFIRSVKDGYVKPGAEPSLVHAGGSLEQWNGNLGPGMLNAVKAVDLAMALSGKNGIGCITLANTNHWMRGGYYGWHAAKKGFVLIAWTNTIANMPAWRARDARMGNNPFVFAVPFSREAIVLDMAMSQFSFGSIQYAAMKEEMLPVNGGYNTEGQLTKNPSEIIASRRTLPMGYWKGAGMSLLLDILAAILSGGLSTAEISRQQSEHAISQVFIAIDLKKLKNYPSIEETIRRILEDYKQSETIDDNKKVSFPGERVLETRRINTEKGIPVIKKIWDEVLNLS